MGGVRIKEGESPTARYGTTIIDGDTVTNVWIGEARPDFTMGFSNTIRYNHFSLYGLVDWRHGGDILNLTAWLFDRNGNSADYAAPCNQPRCRPNETLGEMRVRLFPSSVTSIYLEDASFIKLRELRLSWNVPPSIIEDLWASISSARVSLSGRDLLTLTDYTGMDPEVSNVTEQWATRNQDLAPYPPSRSFWLTLQLSF